MTQYDILIRWPKVYHPKQLRSHLENRAKKIARRIGGTIVSTEVWTLPKVKTCQRVNSTGFAGIRFEVE